MATVPYVLNVDLAAGSAVVQWSGLSVGDDGEPFLCRGLVATLAQTFGNTSGSATLDVEGTIEITPTDFRPAGGGLGFNTVNPGLTWVRPKIVNGDGSTDMTLVIAFRK